MTREHGVDPFDDDAAAPERAARLVRTAAAPEDRITLTDEQEAIASLAPGHGAVLVLGAPGTGRTTVAIELRGSWTPTGPDLGAHLLAFCDLLTTAGGLPPEGVSVLSTG